MVDLKNLHYESLSVSELIEVRKSTEFNLKDAKEMVEFYEENLKLIDSIIEKKKNDNIVEKLFRNKDFLKRFLSSDSFLSLCKEEGYDIHKDDAVEFLLPKFESIFVGGAKNWIVLESYTV